MLTKILSVYLFTTPYLQSSLDVAFNLQADERVWDEDHGELYVQLLQDRTREAPQPQCSGLPGTPSHLFRDSVLLLPTTQDSRAQQVTAEAPEPAGLPQAWEKPEATHQLAASSSPDYSELQQN